MITRTIKAAAADSHVSAAAAKAAARLVYRDSATGKFVIAGPDVSTATVRERAGAASTRQRRRKHSGGASTSGMRRSTSSKRR
jgi:hypothetical protein